MLLKQVKIYVVLRHTNGISLKASGARTIAAGIIFSILWASASTATKTGLRFAQPFVISIARFFFASGVMLLISHGILKNSFPKRKIWKKIAVYGLLNIAVYLGIYIIAMQYVSAGIGSLFIATNPVFISLISAVWLKQKIRGPVIVSLFICSAGILVAAYPLLLTAYVTPQGLLLLLLAMLSYSVSAIYFSRQNWQGIDILTTNGWQTLFGGIMLLPFFFFTFNPAENHLSFPLIFSILWLAVPVSIGAVQLWIWLLKLNPVKAAFWLFLCPISGFLIAAVVMNEPISIFTVFGVLLVLAGLYLVQVYGKTKTD